MVIYLAYFPIEWIDQWNGNQFRELLYTYTDISIFFSVGLNCKIHV